MLQRARERTGAAVSVLGESQNPVGLYRLISCEKDSRMQLKMWGAMAWHPFHSFSFGKQTHEEGEGDGPDTRLPDHLGQ